MNGNKLKSLNKDMRKEILKSLGAALLLCFMLQPLAIFPAFASEPAPAIGSIGSVELEQIFELIHLVDCRSRFEYDILHMKNATHVPVDNMVKEDLQRLRAKDPAKAIVFYGNGEKCPESRAAYLKAAKWGYENIFFASADIFSWAKERPEKALFLGKILDPASQAKLFPSDQHLENYLPPGPFIAASRQPGAMVVDIRDRAEHNRFAITLPNLKYLSLDRLVTLIKSGSRKVRAKKMCIIDSCGGRSQWLPFVFADRGIDYVILQGGVAAWRQAGFDSFGKSGHGDMQ